MIAIDAGIDSQLFTKRGHKQVMRKIIRIQMAGVQGRLHRHFERNADTAPGGAYGYEKRTAKYQRRKAKQAGHQIPLVLTGKLKEVIQANVKITATATRGRLTTRGYFPRAAQRVREIEAVSKEEVQDILDNIKQQYLMEAQKPENQDIIRRRKRK